MLTNRGMMLVAARRSVVGRRLASAYKLARGSMVGLRYWMGSAPAETPREPRVTIDIRRFVYGRYFYSFVKFLTLEGIAVDLRFRPETIHGLSHSQYGNLVLPERLVSLTVGRGEGRVIGDRAADVLLEPLDFLKPRDPATYVVPMTQHPRMYALGLWNRPVAPVEPLRAVFFAGNAERALYSKIDADGAFDVIGRVRLCDILSRHGLVRDLPPGASLASARDGEVVTIPDARIEIADFRQALAGFAFFLCAPGVFMPLCHNLIEAMSVGAIPLIQRSYAELLDPALEHGSTAIVFAGESDLVERVGEALAMSPAAIAAMRRDVLAYYEAHLTPRAVAARALAPEVRTIRMLAGNFSVALLRERRAAAGA